MGVADEVKVGRGVTVNEAVADDGSAVGVLLGTTVGGKSVSDDVEVIVLAGRLVSVAVGVPGGARKIFTVT